MNYIPYERIPVPAVWAAFALFVIAGILVVAYFTPLGAKTRKRYEDGDGDPFFNNLLAMAGALTLAGVGYIFLYAPGERAEVRDPLILNEIERAYGLELNDAQLKMLNYPRLESIDDYEGGSRKGFVEMYTDADGPDGPVESRNLRLKAVSGDRAVAVYLLAAYGSINLVTYSSSGEIYNVLGLDDGPVPSEFKRE